MGPKIFEMAVGEPGAASSGASPQLSRILMEDGWIDRLCHATADQEIPI